MKKTYTGSCHCGKVRFEAELDLAEGTGKCNCSICAKSRNWGMMIKPAAFCLLTGKDDLTDYQFNTNSVHHYFCSTCGVRSFAHGNIPEAGGEFYSVTLACLDEVSDAELAAIPVRFSNGRDNDWMNTPTVTAHL
ncbi:MAG: GFA family protein [Gammaproteobacteria bacterium]